MSEPQHFLCLSVRLCASAACLLLCEALVGCAREKPTRPSGPASPRECWRQVQKAVAARDHAALYELLSSRDHAAVAADLEQLQESAPSEQATAAEKLGLSGDRLAELTPKEYFVRFCRAASERNPADRLSSAKLKRVEQERSAARLFVKPPDGEEIVLSCVREPLASAGFPGQSFAWFLVLYSP